MTVVAAKWTLEEYHQMIDSGVLENRHVELIKGEIIEMAPEGKPHADFSSKAGNYFVRLLGERAEVRHAKPITLPDQSEPEPDVALVQFIDYLDHHPYPENIFLLIEYSESTLKKDLELKSQIYAEAEIIEYWVVNLKNRSVIVFKELQAGRYTTQSVHTDGSIEPVAFPDLSIPVSNLVKRKQ
ncbi:MAG: Uma2 family endonuclease [Cyanobacteria bacterium P01_D01_bin.36]